MYQNSLVAVFAFPKILLPKELYVKASTQRLLIVIC